MNPATILILEERPANRTAMGAELSSKGYAVTETRTVPEAAAALDLERVDAAIIGLAGRASAEIIGLLRRLSETREVPVILVTDLASVRELPQEALPAVAEVLARSRFSIAELVRIVDLVVGVP